MTLQTNRWKRQNGRYGLLHGVALFVAIAWFPGYVAAQQASHVVDRYQLDIWTAQDDVRLAFTSNLVETRDGYLWLSSESGLTRFDGFRFKVFDAVNAPALHGRARLFTIPLAEDNEGGLWIGSDGALYRYSNGDISIVVTNPAFRTDIVNAIRVDSKDTAWAITRSGRVFRISREGDLREIQGTTASFAGSGMSVDQAGDIWIAAGEGALYRVHEGKLSKITLPRGTRVDNANRVCPTRDGSVWFGTATAILQWREGRVRRVPLPAAEGIGVVSALAEGPDGTLWVGTYGAGLYWFDGQHFTSFSRRDGLSDDRVIDILPDRAGNIWVATRDGLNRFRPLLFDVHTSRTGLPIEMPGGMIRDSSGLLWLAPPTGGLFMGGIDATGARFTQVEGVRTHRVTSFAQAREGGIWVGRQPAGSVTRFAKDQPAAEPIVTGLPPVTDVLEDRTGALWVGTLRGLFRVRSGEARAITARDGLPEDYVLRLFEDATGVIWIATLNGIARVDQAGDVRIINQLMPAGSVTRPIVLFEAPKGSLWVGSAEGLARVSGGRPAFVTVAQGLPESWVGAGEEDSSGHLWLGQLGGLTRINLDELTAVADGRVPALTDVVTYEAIDGLPGGDPAGWPHPWSFRDELGKLWFAMGHGIVAVDPSRAEPKHRDPILHIEEIAVDGANVPTTSTLTLGPAARRLEVRYTGADLSHGRDVRFRHRLDGFDTEWIDAGTQRVVAYTRLAAGRYRFRVTARDIRGGWKPTEAGVDVIVLAPLYRQLWFITIVACAFLGGLWVIHRAILRTRSAAIYEERSRLAREIHDSLLQGFGGIALQLHAASKRLSLAPSQQPHLDRVLSVIDSTLTQARQLVWDIRQLDDASAGLAKACQSAAHRILGESATAVRVTSVGRGHELPLETRTECLRIIEEALINVRKHAVAANAEVRLRYHWNRLLVTIHDDGSGFNVGDVRQRPGHWGLQGIQERAAQIGAVISVISRPGEGTQIRLAVPYHRWLFFRRRRSREHVESLRRPRP